MQGGTAPSALLRWHRLDQMHTANQWATGHVMARHLHQMVVATPGQMGLSVLLRDLLANAETCSAEKD